MSRSREIWSIGIYSGASPESLRPAPQARNPVLTAADVSDARALFVADPFMLRRRGVWYMFFEIANRDSGKGEIGVATSDDGFGWSYRRIVLAEPFHLSYPLVFSWRGRHYMVPETLGAACVTLYRAEDFPWKWRRQATLVAGEHGDPTLLRHAERWWLFTCSRPYEHDALSLFVSRRLASGWREHPASPLIRGDASISRPAGRIESAGGILLRPTQDCRGRYGRLVRAAHVKELADSSYVETFPSWRPLLSRGGERWNRHGMHHVDAHRLAAGRWLACVDGHRMEHVD